MCLKLKTTRHKRKSPVYAYKLYKISPNFAKYLAEFPADAFAASSYFMDTRLLLQHCGVVESNRPDVALTDEEKRRKEVEYGIHVFNSLEQAQEVARKPTYSLRGVVIVKVACSPHDFVASGVWSDDEKAKCAVYKKVSVAQLVEVYTKERYMSIGHKVAPHYCLHLNYY